MYVVFFTMFFTMFNKHEYNYYIYVIFFTMCHDVVISCYHMLCYILYLLTADLE